MTGRLGARNDGRPGRSADLRRRDPNELVDAAPAGDRTAVARLISLVERGGDPAREVAGGPSTPATAYTVGLTGHRARASRRSPIG